MRPDSLRQIMILVNVGPFLARAASTDNGVPAMAASLGVTICPEWCL
ncbi:MAG TPA: hypothetical protein VL614_04585 [Acetobacteraceae bacterium]|nr:hypothetical protein [Acetobacteraceae bacterium]